MATTAELAASIGSLIATQEKAFAIVNGPATGAGSTVAVASGVIPTFAKKLNDLQNPTNLLVDYVELSDQAGATLGANRLGRKGNIPYFGNFPLVKSPESRGYAHNVGSAGTVYDLICEVPVTAAQMAVGGLLYLDLNVSIQKTTSPARPAASLALLALDFAGGSLDISTGAYVILPDVKNVNVNFSGLILLEGTTNLSPAFGQISPTILTNLAGSDSVANLKGTLNSVDSGEAVATGGGNTPANAATTLKLYIVSQATLSTTQHIACGKMKISDLDINTA